MVAVVLALGLSIGYVTDLAYGYTVTDHGSSNSNNPDYFGTGAQTALLHGEYIVYGAEYTNSYSSLSCGSIQYPIINRIPLLGFYHQESYAGRPTATHLSVPDTKDYTMLGSQSLFGSSGTMVDNSILKGDSSIVYFQDSYVASFLTGFTGDSIKDSKALNVIHTLFRIAGVGESNNLFIVDESDIPQPFTNRYVEFTEIDGETLRYVTQHTNDVLSPFLSNLSWDSSNSITLNGLDGFQDNYFLKSFRVLDGVGSIVAEIDRGDIILSLSTIPGVIPDKMVPVYADASMGPFNMIDSMTQDIPELHLRYWAVNETAELQTLFTHTGDDDWTTLYILKPIYVINGPITLDDFDVIMPNYAWSNVGFVQCEHSAYNPGAYNTDDPIRTQFAETAVTPVDCGDTLATALPDNAYVNAIDATMDDLIPHDFCSEEGNSSPTNQPIDVVIPDIPDGTMYDDYLIYNHIPLQTTSIITIQPNPDKFPLGGVMFTDKNGAAQNDVCDSRVDSDGSTPKVQVFGGVIYIGLAATVPNEQILKSDTTSLTCNNLAIQYNGTQINLDTFTEQITALEPYYLTMIDTINSNYWGWGTFQSTAEDASQPNQYVMGVPFIMVLAILSCMSGFNGRYIIPSIIVYLMLIASFTYLEIISITDGIIGGLVMLGLIAIFSKGFR